MLTLKERRIIRRVVKQYCSNSWIPTVRYSYKKIKKHDVKKLMQNMDDRFNNEICVKFEEAYTDLIDSYENLRAYIENNSQLADAKFEGVNASGGKIVDFTGCFANSSCRLVKTAVGIHNDLKCGYKNYSDVEKRTMILLFHALFHQAFKRMEHDDIWSYEMKVKEIKAAEEKYGEKFFVNDWLYDTFMHPELFESYGVYRTKNEANYSLNKANIIQDRL